MAKQALPGRFTPNCRGVQCGLASDLVAAGTGSKGGTEGGGGFRMLTDARPCSLMPFFFVL